MGDDRRVEDLRKRRARGELSQEKKKVISRRGIGHGTDKRERIEGE